MMNPWLGLALSLGALLGLIRALHVYRARSEHHELTRKLIHIGVGLITLSFPWLFDAVWPVIVWSAVVVSFLIGLRFVPRLKDHYGGVVDSVARQSLGEIYFPLSVAILFVLSGRDPLLYCVPIVILALADTAAALVGSQYGHWRYTTVEGSRKSAEGSVAFFTVAFFSVHVPLLLSGQAGRAETLLIGVILGLMVTLFEAIAWRGLDNLFIPLGGFVLLKDLLGMSVPDLALHLGILAVVALIASVRRPQTTLDDSALLSAVLGGYVIWVLGGWQWIVIPLILFLRGRPLPPVGEGGAQHFHHVSAVLSVAGPGLAWLFLAKTLQRADLFYPFALTFAVHLAAFEIARLKHPLTQPAALVGVLCGVKSWLMLFIPFLLIEAFSGPLSAAWERALAALPLVIVASVVVVLASVGFLLTQPRVDELPNDAPRWIRQAAWSALGSVVGLVPLFLSQSMLT